MEFNFTEEEVLALEEIVITCVPENEKELELARSIYKKVGKGAEKIKARKAEEKKRKEAEKRKHHKHHKDILPEELDWNGVCRLLKALAELED